MKSRAYKVGIRVTTNEEQFNRLRFVAFIMLLNCLSQRSKN